MMDHWLQYLRNVLRPLRGQEGQDLAEYGLLAALIALFCVVAVTFLGNRLLSAFWAVIAALFP